MNKSGGEERKFRIITDKNRHGIRREYPAAGYKTIKKFTKKAKNR